MPPPLKTFTELTERQQKACHAFSRKYSAPLEIVAAHLDLFFQFACGEIDIRELEQQTGFQVFDYAQPTLF